MPSLGKMGSGKMPGTVNCKKDDQMHIWRVWFKDGGQIDCDMFECYSDNFMRLFYEKPWIVKEWKGNLWWRKEVVKYSSFKWEPFRLVRQEEVACIERILYDK